MQRELEEAQAKEAADAEAAAMEEEKDDGVMRIYFDPPHYTVMENIGTFDVTIVRKGGDLNTAVCVDYKTEDGKNWNMKLMNTHNEIPQYAEAVFDKNLGTRNEIYLGLITIL